MNLHRAFLAGFTRRWHVNPVMSAIEDRVDAHSGRVVRILIMMHPDPSIELLKAAATHDDGEFRTGDISWKYKRTMSADAKAALELEEAHERAEIWGTDWAFHLGDLDQDWLRFADLLDAFMWVAHHRRDYLQKPEWGAYLEDLMSRSRALGVYVAFTDLLDEML